MKKIICLAFCMASIMMSFAQASVSDSAVKPLTKQEYLQKAKRQRTGGIITLSAGGALIIAGGAILINDATKSIGDGIENNFDQVFDPYGPKANSKKHTGVSIRVDCGGSNLHLGRRKLIGIGPQKQKTGNVTFV